MNIILENLNEENIKEAVIFNHTTHTDIFRKNVWLVHLKYHNTFCFIAKENNRIVGIVLAMRGQLDNYRSDSVHITHLVVDENYRNKGIATKLMLNCISNIYKKIPNEQISLNIRISHFAIPFFKRLGFLINNSRNAFFNDPIENSYYMIRQRESKIDKKYHNLIYT